jgi:DivIVA domain-containing protein
MEWFVALVIVIVIGVAAVASTGRLGQFGPAGHDRPEPNWPEGPLTAADIGGLGFAVVTRGYAMDQVDEFCDRVEARLAELEALLPAADVTPDAAAAPDPADGPAPTDWAPPADHGVPGAATAADPAGEAVGAAAAGEAGADG